MNKREKSFVLEATAISKTYSHEGKEVVGLDGVSLSIEKGDIYGIIGPSGAGKSTLIRCLASLIEPTAGKVLFHGSDLGSMGKKELRTFRQKAGMIFQHFNLLGSRTVAGNIAYPLEIEKRSPIHREERIDELLRLVSLTEKKGSYPARLSGGEKQRVGIARALANHPELLFCDEATSALDPKTTKEILDLLKNVNQTLGVTIILITHDMEVIKRICSKVAVIEKGRIVENGSVSQVFSDPQHPITKQLIQTTAHEIPKEFFKPPSPNRKLLRLHFKGTPAGEPIISQAVKKFGIDANILSGWLDRLQTMTVGTLIVEFSGTPEGISAALAYLSEKSVHYEVLENGL